MITSEQKNQMTEKVVVAIDPELKELIPSFLANKRRDVGFLADALVGRDFDAISRLAHRLKGEGGSYGFDLITDLGRELEDAAQSHDARLVQQCIDRLGDYLANVEVVFAPS